MKEKEVKSKNIYQRIHAVMCEVDYIQKGEKKVNNQYRFVSHDQVIGAVQPALKTHGIVMVPSIQKITQDGNRTEVLVSVDFVNIDAPEEKVSVVYAGYGIDGSDKGPGKAVSYAIKYALLKTFCLETGDDPDNEITVHEPKMNDDAINNYIESWGEQKEMFLKFKEHVMASCKWTEKKALTEFVKHANHTKTSFEKWLLSQRVA